MTPYKYWKLNAMTSISGYGESFENYRIINIENLVTKRRQNCKTTAQRWTKAAYLQLTFKLMEYGVRCVCEKIRHGE